ncbi:MAG: hypothetical protein ACRC4T_08490 [Cetobacterium sp.]
MTLLLLKKYKDKLENDNLNTATRAILIEIIDDLKKIESEIEATNQYFEDFFNSL